MPSRRRTWGAHLWVLQVLVRHHSVHRKSAVGGASTCVRVQERNIPAAYPQKCNKSKLVKHCKDQIVSPK